MTKQECKTTAILASLFSFRMLGLFMILPVFSLYAHQLKGATPALIGIALGIYGLTQGLLQLPFGLLSDRFGRKPIITLGLIFFAVGSVIAGFSHSIFGVILGRALQGTGAIGSTLIAFIADTTSEKARTKAMAFVGASIGFSFMVAMAISPPLTSLIGVPGLFFFTALLAIIGLLMLYQFLPKAASNTPTHPLALSWAQFKTILFNPNLFKLNIGIFCLHAILTAFFVVVPTLLVHYTHIDLDKQWSLYLIALLGAFVAMLPLIVLSERKGWQAQVFSGSIALLMLSLILFGLLFHSKAGVLLSLWLFLTAFTVLEASLPALVSKTAPASSKGAASGVYSSFQFIGIFFGGTIGGFINGFAHFPGVIAFTLLLAGTWLALTLKMPPAFVSQKVVS